MIFVLTIFFFIFGLIVGSFLNVVIYRFNTARSFGGRSACMSCQKKLCWYELIPLVSFLGQRGRCRNCQTKISIQYLLVELTTGLIFASLFFKLFFIFNLTFIFTYIYYVAMFSLLLVVAVYDLRHKIIPDLLSFIFGALAFTGLFFFHNNNLFLHVPTLLEFFSGLFIAAPFALLWLISQGAWMGLGDAKLALGLGWFLGLSLALSAIVVAFWIGAIVGLGLIVFSKIYKGGGNYGMKSEIPFALYLVLGTFFAFVFELNLFQISF